MWNKIKKLFINSSSSSKKDTNSKDNILTVTVTEEGKIIIDLDIPNNTSIDAENFGSMLFLLNEGHCVQTILDLLFDLTFKHKSYSKFMEQAVNVWSKKIEQVEAQHGFRSVEDIPIISPSQFYANIGHKQ